MTERKPAGVSFETWVDAQVRAGQERGAFDNLPGAGKPIPGLDQPYDEDWWVKRKIRDEGLPTEALLPTSLRLRKELEQLADTVRDLPSERLVREAAAELNERIVAWLRSPTPPHVPVRRVDLDQVVERWRAQRPRVPPSPRPSKEPAASWWRRLTGRSR
jgi:hypothetical protein